MVEHETKRKEWPSTGNPIGAFGVENFGVRVVALVNVNWVMPSIWDSHDKSRQTHQTLLTVAETPPTTPRQEGGVSHLNAKFRFNANWAPPPLVLLVHSNDELQLRGSKASNRLLLNDRFCASSLQSPSKLFARSLNRARDLFVAFTDRTSIATSAIILLLFLA